MSSPRRHATQSPQRVRRVDEHGVADGSGGDVVADRVHPARVLVPEHDRRPEAGRLHEPVDGVQVGRADAGAADPDDDVARAARLGLRPFDQLERPVVRAEQRRLHALRR